MLEKATMINHKVVNNVLIIIKLAKMKNHSHTAKDKLSSFVAQMHSVMNVWDRSKRDFGWNTKIYTI